MTTSQKVDQTRQAEEKLEVLLIEGLASGPPEEATPEYWQELLTEAEPRTATRTEAQGEGERAMRKR